MVFEMTRWVGEDVMANDDLVSLILRHAPLTPQLFVVASRVNKAWRSVCLRDEQLLLKSLARCKYCTKGTVMGLFGLTSAEANRLPRSVSMRRDGGLMYQYDPSQVQRAFALSGGMAGRKMRLAKRAVYETNVAQVYGDDWRNWWDLTSTRMRVV